MEYLNFGKCLHICFVLVLLLLNLPTISHIAGIYRTNGLNSRFPLVKLLVSSAPFWFIQNEKKVKIWIGKKKVGCKYIYLLYIVTQLKLAFIKMEIIGLGLLIILRTCIVNKNYSSTEISFHFRNIFCEKCLSA